MSPAHLMLPGEKKDPACKVCSPSGWDAEFVCRCVVGKRTKEEHDEVMRRVVQINTRTG